MTNSLIATSYNETSGYTTIQLDDMGFYCFRPLGEECHVGHLYVAPKYRKQGVGYNVIGKDILETAKKHNCTYLSCVVDFKDREPLVASHLVKCYLNFGFHIESIFNNCQVILKRDI